MEKNPVIGKGLAVGIILLFVGVAVVPSINFNVVKASNDDDLVEMRTEACGINGFGNTTVKLTRQQYQNLEQYLVEFRARLNQTSTREEAVPIFKEAVVELDKYGLLPKRMNIETAKRLVTRFNDVPKLTNLLERTTQTHLGLVNGSENHLCLMAGKTTDTWFEGPMTIFSYMLFLLSLYYYGPEPFSALFFILTLYCFGYLTLFSNTNPFAVFYRVNLGGWTYEPDSNPVQHFASGWLYTLGINGVKTWQGEMWGALPIQGTTFVYSQNSPGAVCFTGIKISPLGGTAFYLGSALWVKISG